jgi:DNA-binding NarL/FixJ family response regulator
MQQWGAFCSVARRGPVRFEQGDGVLSTIRSACECSIVPIVEAADSDCVTPRPFDRAATRKPALTIGRAGFLEARVGTDHDGGAYEMPLRYWNTLCDWGWHAVGHEPLLARKKVTFQRVPGAPNSMKLSTREFQVVYLASLGCSGKQAAAELGLSHARVRTVSSAALQKLTLPSCSQLPQLWCAIGRGVMRRIDHPACETVIFDVPFAISKIPESLTSAEYQVLFDLLAGQQNNEIAKKRRTSARTVANQLATLFDKFGVASRGELAAKALGIQQAAEHAYWLSL